MISLTVKSPIASEQFFSDVVAVLGKHIALAKQPQATAELQFLDEGTAP